MKFTVEFGNAKGRNFSVASLGIRNIRGRFSIADMHSQEEGSYNVEGRLASMPAIPGMHLEVSVKEKKARLYDPLSEDSEKGKVRRINAVLKGANMRECQPAEDSTFKFDDDQLKTLLLELRRMKVSKKLTERKGSRLPSEAEVAKLAGEELNDLWNSSTTKPRYKKDQADYERRVDLQS